jgi:hypothetical protein
VDDGRNDCAVEVVDEGFGQAELPTSALVGEGCRGCIASLRALLAPC